VAPYLALMSEDAPQRRHDLREVFNALRWIVRAGAPCRMLPHDFPRWETVYQQTQRWIKAGCFEAIVGDLRAMLRWSAGRADQPTAVIIDSATRHSTPASGHRAGNDGHKKRTDPRSTPPSTPWASCWCCASPRPTPATASRSKRWPQTSRP
jgi:transposase